MRTQPEAAVGRFGKLTFIEEVTGGHIARHGGNPKCSGRPLDAGLVVDFVDFESKPSE